MGGYPLSSFIEGMHLACADCGTLERRKSAGLPHCELARLRGPFVWVVEELVNGRDSQCELTGSVVSGGSEVDEVFKSPSHSFCQLDYTVDGLDRRGGQLSVEVG